MADCEDCESGDSSLTEESQEETEEIDEDIELEIVEDASEESEEDSSEEEELEESSCSEDDEEEDEEINLEEILKELEEESNIEEEIECPDNLKFLQNKEIGLSGSFIKNKDFYIKHLAQFNITLKKSFSKHFDLLILGENSYEKLQNNENAMSGKVKIAQEYSIQIVTEQQILDLLKG